MAAREDRSRSPRRATSYADLEGFLPDGMDSANPIFQQVKATLEAQFPQVWAFAAANEKEVREQFDYSGAAEEEAGAGSIHFL